MHGYITLYMNTGFNGTDIPASPQVLENAVKTTYPYNYFERMDVDLKSIDLKAQYEHVRQCDYLKFTVDKGGGIVENFYYRCIPQSIAKGVTRLSLELDALLTLGGAENLTYISGWQERGHIAKADDVLFGNVAAENWIPSQELVTVNTDNIKPTGETKQIGKGGNRETYTALDNDLTVVVSSTDIHKMGSFAPLTTEVIEGIVAGSQQAKMWFPSVPMVPSEDATKFMIWDYTDAVNPPHTFSIPNTAAFFRGGSNTYIADANHTKAGMSNLYSAGQLSLQASYQIPKDYVSYVDLDLTKDGCIDGIGGFEEEQPLSNHPYEYTIPNYTVKNKKCFSTYRTYVIAALASGDMIIKKPSELYKAGDAYPSYVLWCDPCSTGKPYCRFKYIKDNPILWQDVVRGLQWQNSQIVIQGASGSVWNSMSTAFANQAAERAKAQAQVLGEFNLRSNQLDAVATDIVDDRRRIAAGAGVGGGLADMGLAAISAAMPSGYKKEFDFGGGIDFETDMKNAYNRDVAQQAQNQAAVSAGGAMVHAMTSMATSAYDTFKGNQATFENEKARLLLAREKITYDRNFAKEDAQIALNKNGIELLKNNNVVAPSVSFTPEQNLGMYGYNYFVAYEIRKTDQDLKSEDMYYQRYGYNGLHRPLTQQCFKERTHYNYVQAFDINLTGVYNYGMRVNAAAIAQLNGGVRVWRELPTLDPTTAYETN